MNTNNNIIPTSLFRHNVARQAQQTLEVAAIMQGLDPSTVPPIPLRAVGGVHLPVGTSLGASSSSAPTPWGEDHPEANLKDRERAKFSTAELDYIRAKLKVVSERFPDKGKSKLASHVLNIVVKDPSARKIFHERHIVTVDRFKTGVKRLLQLDAEEAAGGSPRRRAKRRQRDEYEDEDEDDDEEEGEEEDEEE